MIHQHFSTPILCLDNFLNETESMKDIVLKQFEDKEKSAGNLNAKISTTHWFDQHVHKLPGFDYFNINIIKQAELFATKLGYNIYRGLAITRMWANIVEENDYHHFHAHGGALISGVFYLDAPTTAEIKFLSLSQDIEIEPDNRSKYNELQTRYRCKPNRLLLFKGSTKHGYDCHNSTKAKISLAFNFARIP